VRGIERERERMEMIRADRDVVEIERVRSW